jgi:D-3-phosphoglycerate dehydrogenase
MNVLITDAEYPNIDIERAVLEDAGLHVELAHCHTAEDVIHAGHGAQVLVSQYAPITRDVLEQLPDVRLVCRYGVGVDTIDLDAATERGVWVAHVPDYGVEEVASHALAMALALVRHLPWYDREIRAGHWHFLSTGALRRLSSLTVGIVGMGRIGRAVAARARPCFGRLLGYDPFLSDSDWPEGVERVEWAALFAHSQVVSLHLPLTEQTHGLVNRQVLQTMPAGSYLVNTARGGLIDVDDVLHALDTGQLAGAALDVLPHEPPPSEHRVLQHSQILLSPHAAWYSAEAEAELRRKVALNIIAWARDGRPLYPVGEGRTRHS